MFPHIQEIGVIKNSAICLDGFPEKKSNCFRLYYIQEGRFEWYVNQRHFTLYPGDLAIILPGIPFGNRNGVLEIGSFCWIDLNVTDASRKMITGLWSNISKSESAKITSLLYNHESFVFQKFPEASNLLKQIQAELFTKDLGHVARVNFLLDDLVIHIARQCTQMSNPGRDFPATFLKLEQELRKNLSHQWTVEEMAAIGGLGTTLFNEKVKSYSGFSPQNYLINIRISEAIKLLKRPDISLTDIALETGFYSSQHFSTTFKKLTGYTPSQFRKNHL